MELSIPERWEEARDMLLPVVKRVSQPANAFEAERANRSNRLVRRPFVPFLNELVMLDLPDVRMFVNHSHLETWKVSAQAVFEAAHEVLKDHATDGIRFEKRYGLWQLDAPDGAAASRLLLDGWLGGFEEEVEGKPIAIMPWNRLLMVGGSEDDAQLTTLLGLAEEGWRRAPSPISPCIYTVDDNGRVVPFSLSPVARRHTRLAANERRLAVHEYQEQRDLLSQVLEVSLPQLHFEYTTETGESYTWCRWERTDEVTWLPVADQVSLVSDDETLQVSWASLLRLAPSSLSRVDVLPYRFQANWPGIKEWMSLRGVAIED